MHIIIIFILHISVSQNLLWTQNLLQLQSFIFSHLGATSCKHRHGPFKQTSKQTVAYFIIQLLQRNIRIHFREISSILAADFVRLLWAELSGAAESGDNSVGSSLFTYK